MMEVTLEKNMRNGWTAKTDVKLADLDDGKTLVFQISTSKSSGGYISTSFSVCRLSEGQGYSTRKHILFEDFMKHVRNADFKSATEKNVKLAHELALTHSFPAMYEQVKTQYAQFIKEVA